LGLDEKNRRKIAMEKINLSDARTRFCELARRAAAGEEFVIVKNGKPRAKIVAIDPQSTSMKTKFIPL
jgi:prevent-host-death family protein